MRERSSTYNQIRKGNDTNVANLIKESTEEAKRINCQKKLESRIVQAQDLYECKDVGAYVLGTHWLMDALSGGVRHCLPSEMGMGNAIHGL